MSCFMVHTNLHKAIYFLFKKLVLWNHMLNSNFIVIPWSHNKPVTFLPLPQVEPLKSSISHILKKILHHISRSTIKIWESIISYHFLTFFLSVRFSGFIHIAIDVCMCYLTARKAFHSDSQGKITQFFSLKFIIPWSHNKPVTFLPLPQVEPLKSSISHILKKILHHISRSANF
jgi:hypothetical protein